MKLLNLFSVVTLIGTTWLLTGCGDLDSKLEGIETCPEFYILNAETNTCEPKETTLDDSTAYSCPDGTTWSKGEIEPGTCVSEVKNENTINSI